MFESFWEDKYGLDCFKNSHIRSWIYVLESLWLWNSWQASWKMSLFVFLSHFPVCFLLTQNLDLITMHWNYAFWKTITLDMLISKLFRTKIQCLVIIKWVRGGWESTIRPCIYIYIHISLVSSNCYTLISKLTFNDLSLEIIVMDLLNYLSGWSTNCNYNYMQCDYYYMQ